ncbi:DUF6328 family protein [Arthrobacter sp. NPDC097144]|uniref:DUF6328 family protein n=1 Tax=Arthrobacter sp. NPDC097144 TaxID=3363946 RepID=UPI00382E6F0D
MGTRVPPTGSEDDQEPSEQPEEDRQRVEEQEAAAAVERRETALERIDRNWTDLLQELRVLQTGIQILTGFLLTLPFQQRFAELSNGQVFVYLSLVVLSVLITALLMSTVVMHRTFFQLRIKPELVRNSDILLRVTIILVGFVLVGTLGLVFDLVLGSGTGAVAAVVLALILVFLWSVLPLAIRHRALNRRDSPQ